MRSMLAATLIQALRDATQSRMAQEVREFVLSDFCASMCEAAGVDYRQYRKAYFRRLDGNLHIPQMRPGPPPWVTAKATA